MTPNLRLDQHQRFRTALRQKLSTVRSQILNNNRSTPKIAQIQKQTMEARGRLET